MPSGNSTRGTQTRFASTFTRCFTCWASLDTVISEISIMNFTVTCDTESNPVGHLKAQARRCGEWLNMMSMEIACCTTLLASEVVSLIYGTSPILELSRESCSFRFKARPTFPCGRQWTNFAGASTMARAKLGFLVGAEECFSAVRTLLGSRWVSMRPTSLAAISRSFVTRISGWWHRIITAANFTCQRNGRHGTNIALSFPIVNQVCIDRWEAFTGKKAVPQVGA